MNGRSLRYLILNKSYKKINTMSPFALSIVLLGCIAGSYGQGLRVKSPLDIGIFNDRLIGIDDINLPIHANLRSFLGINPLPGANVVVPGRRGVLTGGIAPVAVPVIAPVTVGKLRRCQKQVCPKSKIPKDCKYTPVLQDLSGEYCRGCDQNVCVDLNVRGVGRNTIGGRGRNSLAGRDIDRADRSDRKDERKQLRKLRRRICRTTDVCLGDSRQELMQGQLRRSLLGGARGGRGAMGGNMIGNMGGPLAGALGLLTNPRPGMINAGPFIGSGMIGSVMGQPQIPFVGQAQVPLLGQNRVQVVGQPQIPFVGQSQIPLVGQSRVPVVGQPGLPVVGQVQPVITG